MQKLQVKKDLFTNGTLFKASKDQVSCELGEETVILQLKAGHYYGMDPVGSRIWQLIQEPKTTAQIITVLTAEYEVDPNTCQNDVSDYLKALLDNGLVEIQSD
jgi:hypothetical protein